MYLTTRFYVFAIVAILLLATGNYSAPFYTVGMAAVNSCGQGTLGLPSE